MEFTEHKGCDFKCFIFKFKKQTQTRQDNVAVFSPRVFCDSACFQAALTNRDAAESLFGTGVFVSRPQRDLKE